MEIIASLASARLSPLPGTEGVAAPSAAATAQFSALMQAPVTEPAPAASALGPVEGPVAPAASDPSSFGERILQGMHGISTDFRTVWTELSETLRVDQAQLGMKEMMELQLRLTQTSVGIEMVSKGVSSATQILDKVVHVQ